MFEFYDTANSNLSNFPPSCFLMASITICGVIACIHGAKFVPVFMHLCCQFPPINHSHSSQLQTFDRKLIFSGCPLVIGLVGPNRTTDGFWHKKCRTCAMPHSLSMCKVLASSNAIHSLNVVLPTRSMSIPSIDIHLDAEPPNCTILILG